MLYLGRSYVAAAEASVNNLANAAGVTGRIRGITKQPAVSIQRALADSYRSDWQSEAGSDQKRASLLLERHGDARWVTAATGTSADALASAVEARLNARGMVPLASRYR